MKVFRFMSKEEFLKLTNNETLENHKKHDAVTNSVGFCFMNLKDNTPESAFQFLSGIVNDKICVVFETNKKLKKSYGIYADPYGSFFDTITEEEYCTEEYDLKDFKIIKMAIPNLWKDEWKWEIDIKKFLNKINKIAKKELEEEKQRKIEKKLEDNYKKARAQDLINFIEKEKTLEIKFRR